MEMVPYFGNLETPCMDLLSSLYQAAKNGDADSLREVIKSDPYILEKVSVSPYSDTPLHIAAMKGHLEFAKLILQSKPMDEYELNVQSCSPLHLAATCGHSEMVKLLLETRHSNCCFQRDKYGRTPLHLAAIRGHSLVIKELLFHKHPSDMNRVDDKHCKKLLLEQTDGDNALHLSVKYNKLSALKELMDFAIANNDDVFIYSKERRGNTVFHLAVLLKQLEIIEYLTALPRFGQEGLSIINEKGLTPMDLLDQCNVTEDLTSTDIRRCLERATSSNSMQDNKEQMKKEEKTQGLWIFKVFELDLNWMKEGRSLILALAIFMTDLTNQGFHTAHKDYCRATTDKETEDICKNIMITVTIAFMAAVGMVVLIMMSCFKYLNGKFWLNLLTTVTCIAVALKLVFFIETATLVLPKDSVIRGWKVIHYIRYILFGLLGSQCHMCFHITTFKIKSRSIFLL